jgi:small GTP-binding protein
MSNSQNPSDKELLATLVEKIGAEPRDAKFDDEGHLVGLNLAGLNLTSLPSVICQLTNLERLVLGETRYDQCKWLESSNHVTSFPTEFKQLTNLQALDLSCTNITALPPEIIELTNLKSLTLVGNNLMSLHPKIGQLANLQSLDLSRNNLTALPPEIIQLTNLQSLTLRDNNLVSLHPEIGQLINLRELSLSRNNLTALPPEIIQLTNLQSLTLVGNNLMSLHPEIGKLTNLQSLELSDNNLTALPHEIIQLSNLKDLHLTGNKLATLHPEIGQLVNLKNLVLMKNSLTSLPPEITQLINLKKLNLWHNRFTSFPSEIIHLTKLEGLYIGNSNLTALPSEIGQLTNLQEIRLEMNKLTALPCEIVQLRNLRGLYLHKNILVVLPTEIAQLNKLQTLELEDNPLRTPPPEIVARGKDDIFDFLRDLAKSAITRYEAKLMIVCEGASGKSSLLRALLGESFDQHLPTTHGIDVKPFQLPHPDKPEEKITLNVWDFGGQQIYHTTHQFFMTKRSLYLLVWNARVDTDQARLDHWLRNIQVLAPNAPVILVATHIDERPADFNYDRFKAAYPQLAGHIGVSNKDGSGIDALKNMLATEAVKLELMEQQWPKTGVAAEERLRDQPKYHLNLAEYTDLCVQQGVAAEIAKTALGGYLHDLGKILYYQDDDSLSDFVVLKPNWLTHAISRVLDDDLTRSRGGILEHTDFSHLWDKDENDQPYERRLYPLFLRLMERFLISFQLETDAPHQKAMRSLVPLLLPHSLPEGMLPWQEVRRDQPEIKMVFRMKDFVPPGIMSWFIVLTQAYTQGLHWREGVRLQYEEHQAEVVLNPSKRELWINVVGPAPSNFFNILQHTINDRILRRFFDGLVYKREIPCNCHIRRGERNHAPTSTIIIAWRSG